jgi:FkbM family methyltransferase
LPIGVSDTSSDLTYYMFNEPALNTFDENIANRPTRNEERYYQIGKTIINVQRLETILKNNLPENKKIDFISIDVEGHELNVIRSNHWEKFRPKCLLIEVLDSNIQDIMRSEIHCFMNDANYALYAKTANTLFYLDTNT